MSLKIFHEEINENEEDRIKNFKMNIKQSFPDLPCRQINERLRINGFPGNLLNSKAECNMPPVIGINKKETENECIATQYNPNILCQI